MARHGSNQHRGGGQPLSSLYDRPLEPGAFLRLASDITAALAEIHKQNIIHSNLRPQNILIDSRTGAVTFTGYSPGLNVPRGSPFNDADQAAHEALMFLSPEQTGRVNRIVDYRTDLYSLGAIFYELITGRPMFNARDAQEWVHCHIARMAETPAKVNRAVPRALSEIVMKLLAKIADERYQSCRGLRFDLQRCLDQWEGSKEIEPFILGAMDVSDRLLFPQKLYGRRKDRRFLLDAFKGVVEDATPQMVMVAGYSGIGKSSLVRLLYEPVVREHGLFIAGKFDQYKRDIPYSTIAEAFGELIRQVLTESEDRVSYWREALRDALGVNAQLIADIIPQVELIIGEQPPAPELPLSETENRFNMAFRQFVSVFSKRAHPLVVFLDDLQWVDPASLKLIEHLITYPDTKYLLIIGAYRDNEVSPEHPLMAALERVRKSGPILRTITLAPLSLKNLRRMAADTLGGVDRKLGALARLVHEKTGGNPFFVIQFVKTLHNEGLLAFDEVQLRWFWDIERIRAEGYTDNIVDLMVGKLQKLSPSTRQELRLAACIGGSFQLHTLAVISKTTDEEASEALREALQEGLLIRSDESSYKFLHDRVRQAAYLLIPEDRRTAVHLQIGRLMVQSAASEGIDGNVFDVVSHLNLGAPLISDQAEKYRVAELDLAAGRKAMAGTAYDSAIGYFATGIELLAERSWETMYGLALDLHLCKAECEYLSGNFDEAERLLCLALSRAKSRADAAQATRVKVLLAMTRGSNDEAVEAAVECLRRFGIEISSTPSWTQVFEEYGNVWRSLGERGIDELIDLPPMRDRDIRAAMEVLSVTITPSVYTNKNLLILVLCHMVNLTLLYGIDEASASGFVWFAVVLGGPAFREFEKAYRFGKLAYDLVEKRNMAGQKGRVLVTFGALVNPWTRPINTSIDILRTGLDAASRTGDLTFACYGYQHLIVQLITRGDPLRDVDEESARGLDFVRKAKFTLSECVIISQQRLIRNLCGHTSHFSTFNDSGFDQDQFEEYLRANQSNLASAAFRYYIRKLQARFMSGDYEEALEAMAKARELLWTSPSFLEVPEYYYYGALALAAHYQDVSPQKQAQYLGIIERHRKEFEDWPRHSPENFVNKYALICAEIARISGKQTEAMRFYEQAVGSARDNGFVQNEGVANELASRFYRRAGFSRIADTYLREARSCYLRWGADGKVRQLEEQHPWLVEDAQPVSRGRDARSGSLDTIGVVKASQAISREIVLSNLLETLMKTVVENAGAQRGCLILLHGRTLAVAAEASVEGQEIRVMLQGPHKPESTVPVSIINYVMRTRESVILDNASEMSRFSADPYIVERKPVSILCLPVERQASLVGMLYLENRLVEGAFTAKRIAFLELLAAQAAISLENATLYLARDQAVEALRDSQARLSEIIDFLPDPLFVIDGEGKVIIWNRALEEMSGIKSENVLGKSDYEHSIPFYNRRRPVLADLVLRSDPHIETKYNFIGREKNVLTAEGSVPLGGGSSLWGKAGPVLDRDGNLVGAIEIVRDITERKRVEKALEESESRLSKIIEFLPDATFAVDINRRVIAWNRAIEKMTGVDKEQILGKGDSEYSVPFYGFRRPLLIDLVFESNEDIEKEYRYVKREGQIITAEAVVPVRGIERDLFATATPLFDTSGEIAGAIECMRDITDGVRAEREVRARAEELTAINRIAMACTSSLEPESVLKRVLEEILAIFGLETGALCLKRPDGTTKLVVRSSAHEFACGDEGQTRVGEDLCRECALAGQRPCGPMHVTEAGEDRASGGRQLAFHAAFPLLIQQQCLGVLCLFAADKTVISDNKLSLLETLAAQIALGVQNALLYRETSEHADTLEQKVRERTMQLETANRELESFSYSVSHDLRAPLRGVDGWGQALVEDCFNQLGEEGRKYLGRIRQETQKMGTLIDGLLELSRVSRRQLSFASVDLSAVARSLGARLKEGEPERRVEFIIEPGLKAQGDARLLVVMLSNLIANSWKFTSKHERGRIEFGRTLINGERVWFVRDDGAGFDPSYARRLFGPFQRMHRTSDFPGSGIGLATVQRIINRHGGRIWAEAQKEKGATFYFTLQDSLVGTALSRLSSDRGAGKNEFFDHHAEGAEGPDR